MNRVLIQTTGDVVDGDTVRVVCRSGQCQGVTLPLERRRQSWTGVCPSCGVLHVMAAYLSIERHKTPHDETVNRWVVPCGHCYRLGLVAGIISGLDLITPEAGQTVAMERATRIVDGKRLARWIGVCEKCGTVHATDDKL